MIELLTVKQASAPSVRPEAVQHISPYINPGHFLCPPQSWVEALISEKYSWQFFRLRYKNLLRKRFREEPERFFKLLEASEGEQVMYLASHTLAPPSHVEVARDFLEHLRQQPPYGAWQQMRQRRLRRAKRAA